MKKLVFVLLGASIIAGAFGVACASDTLTHPGQIQRINIVDLQVLHSQENVVFIDTRTAVEWQRAVDKIPGAIRITSQADFDDFRRSVPTDTIVVTYCS